MKFRSFCAEFIVLLLLVGTPHHASAQSAKVPAEHARANRVDTPYRGGLVTPPLPKPKFTLTDTSGAPFDLWSETQSYVTLLFFGYTHCPDDCPLHMANIASSLQQLPAEIGEQVKVVFVTTDPARDSAAVLRAWLDNFDARFVGLTG